MSIPKVAPADGARSEDELFAPGTRRPIVKIVLAGIEKRLEELPVSGNEDWKRELALKAFGRLASAGTLDNAEAIASMFAGVTDVQIELLVAYDRDGRLGGADWIRDNASASEIWTAFKEVMKAAFPFLVDAAKAPNLVAELLPQLAALLGKQPSTSGAPGSAT